MEKTHNNENNKQDNSLSQYATSFDFEASLKLSNEFKTNEVNNENEAKETEKTDNFDNLNLNNLSEVNSEKIAIAEPDNNSPLVNPEKVDKNNASGTSILSEANNQLNLKLNKLEQFLVSKLNKLGTKQKKSLGYSMIVVGVSLSLLLMVSTFNKLDFSDVLLTPSSKEALTGLLSKANKATDQISNLAASTNDKSITASDSNPNLSDDEILNNWQPITSLLASTEKRRKAVAKQLGVDQGEWILAAFSVDCGDCDRAAAKLNQLKLNGKASNVLAVTTTNQTEATLWKERLGLSFDVRSISPDAFDSTGAVFLPTIIKLQNGVSIGAKENLEGR